MKRVLVILFVALVAATYEIYEEDICCLPEEKGNCKALMPRWYYNVAEKACQKFNYGGCGGNKNNFLNKGDCQKCCGAKKDICCFPKEKGNGTALIRRWYYNIEKGACQRFDYGGCGGNKNNFLTKCDCQKRCGDNKDICCQPMKKGPCRAAIRRWYYNSTNNACQSFEYGGCQGNGNNFEKKCQCEQLCLLK